MNREQRRRARKNKAQEVPQPVVHYVCDPEKNTQCKKTNCHINGGPFTPTKQLKIAKQPVENATMNSPMSQKETAEVGLEVGNVLVIN